MRLVAAIPSVLLAVLLAQSSGPASRQSRERADGGPILLGTDPPGRLRPEPATDAGATVQRDAGAEPVQPLQQQLQQLRARIDALERERAEAQQNARQLDDIVQELQQLRQQVADAEGRRQAAETQQQAQRASMQTAVDSLYVAQQRLAGGDYAIEAQLDQAQAAFTGQAQRDVQAARVALRNRDLAAARALLSAAISHAQTGR